MTDDFALSPVGDAAIVVRFEARVDPIINARVMRLAQTIAAGSFAGVQDIVPSFHAVTIQYDPVRTDAPRLIEQVEAAARRSAGEVSRSPGTPRWISVCYGGEYGPDLPALAAWSRLSETEVIDAHAQVTYRVYMLGFVPGFVYLGSVDPRIAMPRRATPRVRVPAGSVAVAGPLSGIYPVDTPGGWNIIGRTPLTLFDATQPGPTLLAPGDHVRFAPIDPERFQELRRDAERPHE